MALSDRAQMIRSVVETDKVKIKCYDGGLIAFTDEGNGSKGTGGKFNWTVWYLRNGPSMSCR